MNAVVLPAAGRNSTVFNVAMNRYADMSPRRTPPSSPEGDQAAFPCPRPFSRRGSWLPGWQRRQIARQLPAAIETLAVELGRGAGLVPALQTMALRSRPPLRAALAPLLAVAPGATSLEPALFGMRERSGGEELAVLVHAVLVASRCAAPRSAPFLRLARRLRARQAGDSQVRNLLRRARWRARLAQAMLLGALAIPICWRPVASLALLRHPAGWLLLALPAALACRGVLLLERAARIDGSEA